MLFAEELLQVAGVDGEGLPEALVLVVDVADDGSGEGEEDEEDDGSAADAAANVGGSVGVVVGYGLVDSPAGLCSWIVEKFWSWTDCDGDPANVLTRDEMLDNVMLYWLPAAGASSARLYWESFGKPISGTVTVPVGCSLFPKEIFRASRRWAEKQYPDLRYWNEPAKGGHFAAFEQPAIFVDEVRAAYRTIR